LLGAHSEQLATAGPAQIASEAQKHIAAFYAIEKEIRGRSPEERRLVSERNLAEFDDSVEIASQLIDPRNLCGCV
jgi:transposase